MTNNYNFLVIGASEVGKSSFTVQLVQRIFIKKYDATISDSWRKLIEVDGKESIIEILELAHTELEEMRQLLYKSSDMCLVMYSVTDPESFSAVEKYVEAVKKIRQEFDAGPIPFLIFANKDDLETERKISFEHGRELEKRLNIPVVEGCCKNYEPILEICRQLIRMKFRMEDQNTEGQNNNQPRRKRKKECILL